MLLGREVERAAIERLLADARVGTSGMLVVSGEAGIGKSALLAYAAARPSGRNAGAVGAGFEGEASIPFAGLLELLRPVIEHIKRLPAPQAAALRAALALGPGVSGERLVIGAATLGMLASAAEDQPLCVLVDDAHWLDQPSAEAVLFAARRFLADPSRSSSASARRALAALRRAPAHARAPVSTSAPARRCWRPSSDGAVPDASAERLSGRPAATRSR